MVRERRGWFKTVHLTTNKDACGDKMFLLCVNDMLAELICSHCADVWVEMLNGPPGGCSTVSAPAAELIAELTELICGANGANCGANAANFSFFSFFFKNRVLLVNLS
jgi:hypothetical protein